MTSPRPTDAPQPKTLEQIISRWLLTHDDYEVLYPAVLEWAREYGEQCREAIAITTEECSDGFVGGYEIRLIKLPEPR